MYLRIYWIGYSSEHKNTLRVFGIKKRIKEERKMGKIEEAEVLKSGGVVIRYYFGKSVLIPAEVMKREAIPLLELIDTKKTPQEKGKIRLSPRRFVDGGI